MIGRFHLLAAIMALLGHLVSVVGMPLPSTEPLKAEPTTIAVKQKAKRTCSCACGGGCGTTCCCCGNTAAAAEEPAVPPNEHESSWHWVASLQVQSCRGIGPAGMPDLPPALPVVRSAGYSHIDPPSSVCIPSSVAAVALTARPPTPPPRDD